MHTRQESVLIYKVTTSSKDAAGLFNYYSHFLSHAYTMIGCNIYVEAIKGGAVVFYKTLEDFLKIQNFIAKLDPLERLPPPPPDANTEILRLVIELVEKPENISIKELAQIMKKTHSIQAPDISVKIKSPKIVVLQYKSAGTFGTTLKKIEDILGKKMDKITTPLK